jgi:ligand-binding sensor domain-containing protein
MKNGLIHNLVIDIMEDRNGNMWFATPKGVSLFDGMNWKSYNKKDGLSRNMAMSMDEESNGKIWFGSLNGAFSSHTDSTWEYVKKGSGYYNYMYPIQGLIEGVVISMLTGTPGLGAIMLVLFAPLGALPSQATIVYIDSKDNVWLAAQPKGVFMFDGQDWMQYTNSNGLPHKRVNTMLETSDGAIWFGTAKGIAIMNK